MAGGVGRPRGPGPVVFALGISGSLLAGIAIYLYVHQHRARSPVTDAAPRDAGAHVITIDASDERDASEVASSRPPPDAASAAPIDAGRPHDAAVVVAAVDAGVAPIDRNKEAALLKDHANAALEEGDADKALELANQSIKLRRTARAFLTRGRALERLNHLDQALESFDQALGLAPTFPQTWQAKGMALWSARRRDEARPVLEEYLKLAPGAKDAATLRQMLDAHP
ncbi:hypothetical protein BH11MYX1_BH11MYX1_10750 [soil metagenome]